MVGVHRERLDFHEAAVVSVASHAFLTNSTLFPYQNLSYWVSFKGGLENVSDERSQPSYLILRAVLEQEE